MTDQQEQPPFGEWRAEAEEMLAVEGAADARGEPSSTGYYRRYIRLALRELDRLQAEWQAMKDEVLLGHTLYDRMKAENDDLKAQLLSCAKGSKKHYGG